MTQSNLQLEGFLASLNDDTDLTINLNGFTWNVHADLMSAHSPSFAAICNGQWKESGDRTIKIHDVKPRIFARLLQFIYCKDYSNNRIGTSSQHIRDRLTLKKLLKYGRGVTLAKKEMAIERSNYLVVHFEVYELADKYGCRGLQKLAQDNIGSDSGGIDIYRLKSMLSYQNLIAWREMFDNEENLKEIFAHTLAINYKKLKTLVEGEDQFFQILKEWLRWLEEDNGLCMMVVDAMSKKF